MKYEEIQKVCGELGTVDVKGKDYVLVNQRVIAFRKVFPEGRIVTEILKLEGEMCVIQASVFDGDKLIATGLAYEKESSSFINKSSYIENCETSAVGRALGFVWIGIDGSIASAEEVQNAVLNQKKPENPDMMRNIIIALGTSLGKDEEYTKDWCEKLFGGTTKWEDLTPAQLATAKLKLSEALKKNANKGK